ncbi:MAG: sigma-70 family RNA polymerase sigma factor [Patescibacteria group bacterium]|nr:sigma-70 family RNA polymerase sigma factor [Patescibacteria group bacterium]
METRQTDNQDGPLILLNLAKNGDQTAFGRLYELYFTPVYRYVYLRVREKDTAHDLAQTVFLKVFEARERLEDRGKSPLTYFFTVARNTVIDFWRKKKDWLMDEENDSFAAIPDHAPGQEAIAEQKEISAKIKKALKNLSEEQQEIVILKFFNGLSAREISAIVGKSEEAVRQAQCRALKILKEYLREYGE